MNASIKKLANKFEKIRIKNPGKNIRYPIDLKKEAVTLLKSKVISPEQIAESIGIHVMSLYKWGRKTPLDCFSEIKMTPTLRKEDTKLLPTNDHSNYLYLKTPKGFKVKTKNIKYFIMLIQQIEMTV